MPPTSTPPPSPAPNGHPLLVGILLGSVLTLGVLLSSGRPGPEGGAVGAEPRVEPVPLAPRRRRISSDSELTAGLLQCSFDADAWKAGTPGERASMVLSLVDDLGLVGRPAARAEALLGPMKWGYDDGDGRVAYTFRIDPLSAPGRSESMRSRPFTATAVVVLVDPEDTVVEVTLDRPESLESLRRARGDLRAIRAQRPFDAAGWRRADPAGRYAMVLSLLEDVELVGRPPRDARALLGSLGRGWPQADGTRVYAQALEPPEGFAARHLILRVGADARVTEVTLDASSDRLDLLDLRDFMASRGQ